MFVRLHSIEIILVYVSFNLMGESLFSESWRTMALSSRRKDERPPRYMTTDDDGSVLPRQVVLHGIMECEPPMVIGKVTRERNPPFMICPVNVRDSDMIGAMEV